MTTYCLPRQSVSRLLISMSLAAFAVNAQVPAQLPLLVKPGAGVAPNIMLTMDDSGSMAFQHMPEDVFSSDTFATTNPVGSNTVRWDPNDNYNIGVNFQGTVPGNINSTNWVLRALRSPDTNSIFYNPDIRYQPWLMSDGVTRRADSPPAKAFKDPLIQTGAAGTFVDLTAYATPGGNSDWCYAAASLGAASGAGCATYANSAFNAIHDPGVYFRLGKTGATYNAVNNHANYTGYSINNAGPFPKASGRTDCLGATSCTRAEERKNFANWFSYYRNRNLMARGSLMEAFGPIGNVIRVGFGRINKGSASVDGVNTSVVESSATYGTGGVRDFNATRKGQLIDWLAVLPASGGTPLVPAMAAVGNYYSRTDNKGPWTDSPGSAGNSVSQNKTCRRSYQILMTDGYWTTTTTTNAYSNVAGNWTNTAATVGNQDATNGTSIVGTAGTYAYAAAPPYSDGTSATLADYSMMFWKNDLQPAMNNDVLPVGDNKSFWQNMTNFTVGLGVRGTLNPAVDLPALRANPPTKTWPAAGSGKTKENIDDLWHAAINSRGQYFSAKDPQELSNSIATAINSAIGGTGSTTGVATATAVLENGNYKYVPEFNMSIWNGEVTAYPLDANGSSLTAAWTASNKIKTILPSNRNIVTWDAGVSSAVPFKWPNLSATNRAALGSVAATYTTGFVDFIRGDHALEGPGNPFRTRVDGAGAPFVLGDFVNSAPVFIQGGFNGNYAGLNLGGAGAYQSFLTAKTARTGVLFVGGNDGMLHAFQDSKAKTPASALTDGAEIFAYVPYSVYGNLHKLTDKLYGSTTVPHQFFVDGPQNEADAFVRAPGASTPSWRNYLLGSTGGGARAVYALDVTDSPNLTASAVRWEISSATDSDLGYVVQPIEAGVLPNGKWVAIFGNGFSSTAGKSALFVVDIETGGINKLVVDSGPGNGLGGVALVRDANGQITGAYAGDLKGNLWRMDYNASTASNFAVFGGGPLFKATSATAVVQPITATPAIFNHSQGGKIVVLGTGKLFETADQSDLSAQAVYGVWDKPSTVYPITRADSANYVISAFAGTGTAASQVYYSLTGSLNWATNRAWNIDMNGVLPGGKILYPTQKITNDFAYVSVVAPPQTVIVCDSGKGDGINLVLPAELVQPPAPLFDTNGVGGVTNSDALAVGIKSLADGKDSVLKGDAGTGGGGGGGGMCPPGTHMFAAVNSVSGNLMCVPDCVVNCTAPITTRTYDRVWRRIVNPPIR